jgi:hypothetical protein
LLVSVLDRRQRFFGDEFTIEYPTGSGCQLSLEPISVDLLERLISLFVIGSGGRRPCFGGVERMQRDPAWKDNVLFYEYFHGDNGSGLGASLDRHRGGDDSPQVWRQTHTRGHGARPGPARACGRTRLIEHRPRVRVCRDDAAPAARVRRECRTQESAIVRLK